MIRFIHVVKSFGAQSRRHQEQRRLRRMPFSLLFLIMSGLIVSAGYVQAQLVLHTPTAHFDGGVLHDYSVAYITSPTVSGRLPEGTIVDLQYTTGAGVPIGSPVQASLGAGGVLNVPPSLIPAGAIGLGNKVVITDDEGASAKPLEWYQSEWNWSKPTIHIDPEGIPGLTSSQSWFIFDRDVVFTGATQAGTVISSLMTASNFDLGYTDRGNGLFDAQVVGDNSFIRLSDGTHISFPGGTSFGTVQILSNDGQNARGLYDFSAIGASGGWIWESASNYAGGSGRVSAFHAPAISSVVPGPSSLLLFSIGVVSIFGFIDRYRRRLA